MLSNAGWDCACQWSSRRVRVSQTSGVEYDIVQTNVVILPKEYAFDFLLFCQRNPKSCPIIEVLNPGQFEPINSAPQADIRTDIPRYNIYRDGVFVEEVFSIEKYWTDDLVTFLLGCSFTFEHALLQSGIHLRHIEQSKNVLWTVNCLGESKNST